MRRNPLMTALALAAVATIAACDVQDEPEADAEVTEELRTEPATRTIEVPTVDTSVVRRTVDVDTMVDLDVIEDPEIEQEDPEGQ